MRWSRPILVSLGTLALSLSATAQPYLSGNWIDLYEDLWITPLDTNNVPMGGTYFFDMDFCPPNQNCVDEDGNPVANYVVTSMIRMGKVKNGSYNNKLMKMVYVPTPSGCGPCFTAAGGGWLWFGGPPAFQIPADLSPGPRWIVARHNTNNGQVLYDSVPTKVVLTVPDAVDVGCDLFDLLDEKNLCVGQPAPIRFNIYNYGEYDATQLHVAVLMADDADMSVNVQYVQELDFTGEVIAAGDYEGQTYERDFLLPSVSGTKYFSLYVYDDWNPDFAGYGYKLGPRDMISLSADFDFYKKGLKLVETQGKPPKFFPGGTLKFWFKHRNKGRGATAPGGTVTLQISKKNGPWQDIGIASIDPIPCQSGWISSPVYSVPLIAEVADNDDVGKNRRLRLLYDNAGADETKIKNNWSNIRTIKIVAAPSDAGLTIERIDQDISTNTLFESVPSGSVVFGGSDPSTSDNLRFRLSIDPYEAPGVDSITWNAFGEAVGDLNALPVASFSTIWDAGDLPPSFGWLTVSALVQWGDGTSSFSLRELQVGVRTDDVIAVGWIDPTPIVLPEPDNLVIYDSLPPQGWGNDADLGCVLVIAQISEGDTSPFGAPALSIDDREYILHWMFREAANASPATVIPGGDFRMADGTAIDEVEVQDFFDEPTNYKLFNRFQAKGRRDTDGLVLWNPVRALTGTGETSNPCGPVLLMETLDSQTGPFDAAIRNAVLPEGNTAIAQYNDGSPDALAIRAFGTLASKNTASPKGFWESIGSRVLFSDATGPAGNVTVQAYPTYEIYRNGQWVDTIEQAPSPLDHFYAMSPYPFGDVWCGVAFGTIPGGRCGDAVDYPEPEAQTPPYLDLESW